MPATAGRIDSLTALLHPKNIITQAGAMPSLLLLLLLLLLLSLLLLPATAFLIPVPTSPTCSSQPYSFPSSLLATKQPLSITLPPTTHPSTQPILLRFKRRARRRALHLALRRLLPFLFSGWVDRWLERRSVEGEKAWERELLVLANGWQEKNKETKEEERIGEVTEWVVEGPRPLPAAIEKSDFPSSTSLSSCSSAFVLLRAPLNKRERMRKALQQLNVMFRPIFLPPILFGVRKRRGGMKGGQEAVEDEEEEIQEWHLYAAAREEEGVDTKIRKSKEGEGEGEGVVLGKVGIKFREPKTRTLMAVDRAGAALFGWEEEEEEEVAEEREGTEGGVVRRRSVGVKVGGGEGADGGLRPLPVVVLVWCYVSPKARGRDYGEKMMEMVSESLLGEVEKEEEEKEEDGRGDWRRREGRRKRRRGYILLTVDDNGSGRLKGYYQRLGFRMAPSLSSEACEVMLRPITM